VAQRFSRARIGVVWCAAILSLSACDGGGGPRTTQLVSSPSAALPVRVQPFQLQLAQVTATGCPVTQPFMTHFDLVLGPAPIELAVDSVALRLGDTLAPSLVLGTDDLQRLGTSPKIPPNTIRTFTLAPEFGCGVSTMPGSLTVTVTFADQQGRRQTATATAIIR